MVLSFMLFYFFFSSRRRHTRWNCDWSSDVCSSDLESTPANPGGMTTIGERWNRGDSKNHMILAQIEEWFHAGIAGIRSAPGSTAYRKLVFQPKPVGTLERAEGSYATPHGLAKSSWTRSDGRFKLKITVPPNTTAEVRVPVTGQQTVIAPHRATFERAEGGHSVYSVPSGNDFVFVVK